MMNRSLKRLLAEVALAGTGHHCHDEAEEILAWLENDSNTRESVAMIRLSSLMNRARYGEALKYGETLNFPDIEPMLALCEFKLAQFAALELRLMRLETSDNNIIQQFAAGMREQIANER